MRSLELNLYREDFDVTSNYSFLNRILQSISIPLIFLGIMLAIPKLPESSTFICIAVLFGVTIAYLYLSDRYLRKMYPDWPKPENFVGKITLAPDFITITQENQEIRLSISDCQELLIFSNHFTGYSANQRDTKRNGNGLLFYKHKPNEVSIYKFTILNDEQFTLFQALCNHYKETVPYFKTYLPYEIKHILQSDLSDRIHYN